MKTSFCVNIGTSDAMILVEKILKSHTLYSMFRNYVYMYLPLKKKLNSIPFLCFLQSLIKFCPVVLEK